MLSFLIFVFLLNFMTLLNDHRCMILYCKNVVTLEEQGAFVQFLLNVLLIVVMNCFLATRFGQLYCFL